MKFLPVLVRHLQDLQIHSMKWNEWAEKSRQRRLAKNAKKYVYTIDDFMKRDKILRMGEDKLKKAALRYEQQITAFDYTSRDTRFSQSIRENSLKEKIRYTIETAALYSMLSVVFNENYQKPEYEKQALYYLNEIYRGDKIKLHLPNSPSGNSIYIRSITRDEQVLQSLQMAQAFFALHYNKYIYLYRNLCKKDEIVLTDKVNIQSELDCVMNNKRLVSDNVVFSKYASKGTIKSLKLFMKKYPKNLFVGVAQTRIHHYEFAPYRQKNTISAYKEFIKKYPKNPLIKEAKVRFNALEFEPFAKTDTKESYFTFIKKYPKNMYIPLAWERLWGKYEEKGTEKSYVAFIKQYPKRKYPTNTSISSAWEKIWVQYYKDTDSINSLNLFLKKYPNSPNIKDAKNRIAFLIEENDFKKAQKINTEQGYLSFYKKYPNTQRDELYYFLKYFKAERTRSKVDIKNFVSINKYGKYGISSSQISNLMKSFRKTSSSTRDWMFLYDYSHNEEDLTRAHINIKDGRDERLLVNKVGERFFSITLGDLAFDEYSIRKKKKGYLEEVLSSYTPDNGAYEGNYKITLKSKSRAKYNSYKVYVDVKFKANYRRYCDGTLTFLCSDDYTYSEEGVKTVSITIQPGEVISSEHVNLNGITIEALSGVILLNRRKTKLLSFQVTDLEFNRVGK